MFRNYINGAQIFLFVSFETKQWGPYQTQTAVLPISISLHGTENGSLQQLEFLSFSPFVWLCTVFSLDSKP